MRVLAAPDKFRGSAGAADAAHAIATGATRVDWSCRELPLADGGEGTLDAFGGPNRVTTVTGPLGDPVEAAWRLDDGLAVIEMARASGLSLAGGPEHNDPLAASTRGTGELIATALAIGARRIVVAVGGSATTDGGRGALEALDRRPFGASDATVEVASDVQTLFTDAAPLFAPQKGASADEVVTLRRRLSDLADDYNASFGVDVTTLPGGGAAGGLAGGLAALGARIAPGFGLVAAAVGFDAALRDAEIVITGEGLLDRTSFAGKVVGGVVGRALAAGVSPAAIVGEARVPPPRELRVVQLVERYGADRSWADTLGCIADAAEELLVTFAR
jgi:glycerate 2-kinase